nr:MAG TPA: hypothetical protein [Bacteriophage sp.]
MNLLQSGKTGVIWQNYICQDFPYVSFCRGVSAGATNFRNSTGRQSYTV